MLTALALVVLCQAAPAPKDPEGMKERMGEAIRRHDSGDFDGAIAIYRALLKEAPHHPDVVYELSLSMQAGKKPSKDLVAFAEKELKSGVPQLPQLYATLASAYDGLGEYAKGEAALRRGLKQNVKSADLQFNLGINLYLQKRFVDARAPLLEATTLAPDWPAPWFALGEVLKKTGYAQRAAFALARGVALEPRSRRGQAAAEEVFPLFAASVEVEQGEKKVNVKVPKGQADEVMGVALLFAARHTEKEPLSDGAFFAKTLPTAVKLLDELKPDPFYPGALKLFLDAEAAGVLEALAWELRWAAGDKEATAWFSKHPKEEAALEDFMRPHRRR